MKINRLILTSLMILSAGTLLCAEIPIYSSAVEGEPLYLAVKALEQDLIKTTGQKVGIYSLNNIDRPGIIILNSTVDKILPELEGYEAHKVTSVEINTQRQQRVD